MIILSPLNRWKRDSIRSLQWTLQVLFFPIPSRHARQCFQIIWFLNSVFFHNTYGVCFFNIRKLNREFEWCKVKDFVDWFQVRWIINCSQRNNSYTNTFQNICFVLNFSGEGGKKNQSLKLEYLWGGKNKGISLNNNDFLHEIFTIENVKYTQFKETTEQWPIVQLTKKINGLIFCRLWLVLMHTTYMWLTLRLETKKIFGINIHLTHRNPFVMFYSVECFVCWTRLITFVFFIIKSCVSMI